MRYYLDLFSPETYEAFSKSPMEISGFRERQRNAAENIHPGDRLICYMTKLSRWVGVLEVTSDCFIDDEPIFYPKDDPFVVRFRVRPLAWLSKELAIPISEDHIWNNLTFTKEHEKGTKTWTGKIRVSLRELDTSDAELIEDAINRQSANAVIYPFDEARYSTILRRRIRRLDKSVSVTVPGDSQETVEEVPVVQDIRDSLRMQAVLAEIGEKMGLKIWLPKNDRSGVLSVWSPGHDTLLDELPLNYDDVTLKTIEQIDVLWLRGRSIVRAFEVEHTTAVYSGILRMADLTALQPNMDIKLHIVAPEDRRDKVLQEIQRPVFAFLEKGPLSEICTYISYESLLELSQLRHLQYVKDDILEQYVEEPE